MSEYLAVTFDIEDNLYVRCLGLETDSSLACYGPGYRNYYILHYVLNGAGYFNGIKVADNQGFFITSQQLQEYHSDLEDPWNYFWIVFSQTFAEKYILPIINPDENNIFHYSFKGKLIRLCQKIFNENTCLLHTQALGFLFDLIALHESTDEIASSISLQHVQNAKSYIEYNFNKKITVGDVAEKVHVNERYLYNLFIRYEGISLKEYINQQRYNMACELLTNTSLTISEVGCCVGISDVCTFSKFFAKRKGMSPTKYRELHT